METSLLREGYDDEICGSLVRGTMDAKLFDTSSLKGRVHTWLEDGFSRFVLISSFLGGDHERAAEMGITFGLGEKVAAGAAAATIGAMSAFYRIGLRIPVVDSHVDAMLNARLASLLDSYGHADFVTDAEKYALHGDAAPA